MNTSAAMTGEVTKHARVFSDDVYAERRKRLMGMIGEQGAALFVSGPEVTRSNDTHYRYRANSDVMYLTGCDEPKTAVLLLPGHKTHPFVVFVRPRRPKLETWDGPRIGVEEAPKKLGADQAVSFNKLWSELPKLLVGRRMLVTALGNDEALDRNVIGAYRGAQRLARSKKASPESIVDPRNLLHEMRLKKSDDELECLRRACAVSAEAHVHAMQKTRPGLYEYQIQAELEYWFYKHGASAPGYPSIVGSGANACILHYMTNRRKMEDGDLVLVDAGAEIDGYTADITRTWPVNGRFNGRQREIYDLVLQAQMQVIRDIRPGVHWHTLHETTCRVLAQGLLDMGILSGTLDEVLSEKTYSPFFMHGTGHWLGMDVHDVGVYARGNEESRELEAGMVFTVEPGLYFPPNDAATPSEYSGIGVRIEDNVLVTENGCDVLTSGVPKEPHEIEEIVGTGA